MLPGHQPLNPWGNNVLPTTRMMKPVFGICQRVEYRDAATGDVLPNYVPKPNEQFMTGSGYFGGGGGLGSGGGGFGGGGGGGAFPAPTTYRTFSPDQSDFMFNAHLLWIILFGGFGALIARYVGNREISNAQHQVALPQN